MPDYFTRKALTALSKARLRGLATALDRDTPSRALKAEIVETLIHSRRSFLGALRLRQNVDRELTHPRI